MTTPASQVTQPAGPDDEIAPLPATIGRYRILDVLGSGGMGVVLLGHDAELGRRVAIKLLRPGAMTGEGTPGAARQALLGEAQAMARLAHPHVVTVFEAGTAGEQVYVAMELVDGGNLRAWLAEKPRERREIIEAFLAAGRGLAAVHAVGLVHHDFKPENVLIGRDGRVRVGDFGLAGVSARAASSPLLAGSSPHSVVVAGRLVGTPVYMAPEQLRGEAADPRADQYAFCVAFVEALTGERPRGPLGAAVPAHLREPLARGLAREASARWPSMDELLVALSRDTSLRRERVRRMARYAALVSLVLAGFNLGSRWLRPASYELHAYDQFLALNLPLHLLAAAGFLLAARREHVLRDAPCRLAAALVAGGLTTHGATWLVGGPAAGLNLLFAMLLVGFVRVYVNRAQGLVALASVIASDLLFAGLYLALDLGQGPSLPRGSDEATALLALGWRTVVVILVALSADYAVGRFRASERALRQLNDELEERVAAQVSALERAGRLRRYLAPQLVEEVLSGAEDPAASRDRRPISVMWAELAGFTELVDRLSPDELASLLNLYFDEVARIAFRHGGTVDKLMGGAVDVFFGAPRASTPADQAERCLRMALELEARLGELAAHAGTPLGFGLGVASGTASVGGFGSSQRTDFTAVGAPVTRAARLATLGGVVVDGETCRLVGDGFVCTPLGDDVYRAATSTTRSR